MTAQSPSTLRRELLGALLPGFAGTHVPGWAAPRLADGPAGISPYGDCLAAPTGDGSPEPAPADTTAGTESRPADAHLTYEAAHPQPRSLVVDPGRHTATAGRGLHRDPLARQPVAAARTLAPVMAIETARPAPGPNYTGIATFGASRPVGPALMKTLGGER